MFWFDTSTDRNPDFDMDLVPDGSIYYGQATQPYIQNVPERLMYSFGDQNLLDSLSNSYVIVHNQTTMYSWISDNLEISDLVYSGIKEYYQGQYDPTRFFPVDNEGFGNEGDDHNYKWCVWIEYPMIQSRYNEIGILDILHSDDLFVFLDGTLVSYDSIGITDFHISNTMLHEGKPWIFQRLDIINCNRKRRADYHHFEILTNVVLECNWIDQCGMCEGFDECLCQMGYNCFEDEYQCIKGECIDPFTCYQENFNCTDYYPNQCRNYFCQQGSGCQFTEVDCNDNNYCTTDSCDINTGCINTPIDNCVPCGTAQCITTDLCFPLECHPEYPNQCVETPKNCDVDDPCLRGYCSGGICLVEPNCTSSEVPITTGDQTTGTELPITGGSSDTPYTPTTTTTSETIYASIISTLTSTLATTIATTTGAGSSTVATTSFTTDTSLPTITGSSVSSTVISSIVSSTLSAGSTTTLASTTSTTSTTSIPIDYLECNGSSCPKGYCCIQLEKSYTCVSSYFENNCEVNRLKSFF